MLRAILEKLGVVSRKPDAAASTEVRTLPVGLVVPASPTLPPKDAWEGWYDWQSGNDLAVTVGADIRYTDADGQVTERRITTRRFEAEPGTGDVVILARCHLRNENRTFKVSRISGFTDGSTGEIITDIPAYLRGAYDSSPKGRTARLLDAAAAPFTVLLYVARADARLMPKEKAVLAGFLRRTDPDVELDMESVDAAMAAGPSQAALITALKAVVEAGGAEALLRDVDALAAARTKLDDFTSAAVTLVRKRLSKP